MNWKWFWDFLNQFTIWFLDLLWRVHRLRLTVGLKQESHGPLRNHQHPFYKHMYHSHTYIYICVSAIIIVITIIISMIIRHDYNIIQSAVIKYHVRYIYIYIHICIYVCSLDIYFIIFPRGWAIMAKSKCKDPAVPESVGASEGSAWAASSILESCGTA
jgi:hypothetical protein